MHDRGIFIFGSKIFEETRRDAISSLPLEMSWKIFAHLDDTSLRCATHVCKLWNRIIVSSPKLRSRLNKFELAIRLGSKSLAKIHRRNKQILKKLKAKNYMPMASPTAISTETKIYKCKRGAEDIAICAKRYKIF